MPIINLVYPASYLYAMLDVRLNIQKAVNDCAVDVITDLTGVFSASNPGGWGGPNPVPGQVQVELVRFNPDGMKSSIKLFLTESTGKIWKICNTWRSEGVAVVMDDCGCGGFFMEADHATNPDGCYTYLTKVSYLIGGFIGQSEQKLVHLCSTRERLRRVGIHLATRHCSNRQMEYDLGIWSLASTLYSSIELLPEIDCVCVAERLDRITLLLNGIDQ